MANGRFSVIIIPTSGGKTLQFSISKIIAYISAISICIFLIVYFFFTYGFFAKSYQTRAISKLTNENEFLSSRISSFSEQIEKLKGQYTYMVEKENQIRLIFDLPVVDPQERALGIGGPVFTPDDHPSYSRQLAYDAEARLDELIRLSSFEKEQYDSIYNAVAKFKTNLDHTPSIMPTQGCLARGFGVRPDPFTGIRRMHGGLDISNRIGTPIYATADGVVVGISPIDNLGKTLVIDHGNGIRSFYGHISIATVRLGQIVKRGDKIAEIGNTGRSTGPHLHYAISVNETMVNPMEYILNQNWLADTN